MMSKTSPVPLVGSGIPQYSAKTHELAIEANDGYDLGRAAAEIDEYGIRNNTGFRREAELQTSQAIYRGDSVGVIMADLDGLKAVNDELGHPMGDTVIKRAKIVIRDMMEESDMPMLAGRVGGDEFAILCHGDEEQIRQIAEEFRNRYRDFVEEPGNGELKDRKLAFSLGHANLSDEVKDFSDLMRKSDEEMYKDKVGKLGELSRRDKLCLMAARGLVKLSTKKRLRDAPKYWRMLGVLD